MCISSSAGSLLLNANFGQSNCFSLGVNAEMCVWFRLFQRVGPGACFYQPFLIALRKHSIYILLCVFACTHMFVFQQLSTWEQRDACVELFVLDRSVSPSLFLINLGFSSLWKWICLGKASGIITPLHLFSEVSADWIKILIKMICFTLDLNLCVRILWLFSVLDTCSFSYPKSLIWFDLMVCSTIASLEESFYLFLLVWFLCQTKANICLPIRMQAYYRLSQVS